MSNTPIIFDETILQKYPQFYTYIKNIRNAIAGSLLPISDSSNPILSYKNKTAQNLGTEAFRFLSLDNIVFDRQILIDTYNGATSVVNVSGTYNSAYFLLSASFQNNTQNGTSSFRFYNSTIKSIQSFTINRSTVSVSTYGNIVSIIANCTLKAGGSANITIPIPNPINSAPFPIGAVTTFAMIIPSNFSS